MHLWSRIGGRSVSGSRMRARRHDASCRWGPLLLWNFISWRSLLRSPKRNFSSRRRLLRYYRLSYYSIWLLLRSPMGSRSCWLTIEVHVHEQVKAESVYLWLYVCYASSVNRLVGPALADKSGGSSS